MLELIESMAFGLELRERQVEKMVESLLGEQLAVGEKAEFLKALSKKGETANEIAWFAKYLLKSAIPPEIDSSNIPGPLLDICGTGGDRLELFNVSTTSMFVLAAGGACVVKHGNRAITSKCGGADVLEALGIKIELSPAELRASLAQHGCGFIFAPTYHPAFKVLVPVRKSLALQGHASVFNLLGPLLNPARPPHQLVGIYSEDMLPVYAKALSTLGRTFAWAVNGNGMDEISLSEPSSVSEVKGTAVRNFKLDPAPLGLQKGELAELKGGDPAENARILVSILDGSERGPKRDMVLINAAAGFLVAGLSVDIASGVQRAREAIDSGAALAKLKGMQA